jgi:hypothetical protein
MTGILWRMNDQKYKINYFACIINENGDTGKKVQTFPCEGRVERLGRIRIIHVTQTSDY